MDVERDGERVELMDDIDRALLRQLQANADLSLVDLGEVVGLSASGVQRRITKLRNEGIITGTFARLDQHRLGLPVTIVTLVRFERDATDLTTPLMELLRERPEVQQLHTLAGQHDLLVIAVVGDLADYTTGVLADLEADSNVARLETNISLGMIKSTHELPV